MIDSGAANVKAAGGAAARRNVALVLYLVPDQALAGGIFDILQWAWWK